MAQLSDIWRKKAASVFTITKNVSSGHCPEYRSILAHSSLVVSSSSQSSYTSGKSRTMCRYFTSEVPHFHVGCRIWLISTPHNGSHLKLGAKIWHNDPVKTKLFINLLALGRRSLLCGLLLLALVHSKILLQLLLHFSHLKLRTSLKGAIGLMVSL